MIRKLRALGRVLEFARYDPATAFVRRKPRSQAIGLASDHRPDKPKFTGHRRHTGGILKQFDAERHYDWMIGCHTTGPVNGHRRHDEKGTAFGR